MSCTRLAFVLRLEGMLVLTQQGGCRVEARIAAVWISRRFVEMKDVTILKGVKSTHIISIILWVLFVICVVV